MRRFPFLAFLLVVLAWTLLSIPIGASSSGLPILVARFSHGPGTAFIRTFQTITVSRDLTDPTMYVVSTFDGTSNVQFRERFRSTIVVGEWFGAADESGEFAGAFDEAPR